jgi:hypothetical protein
VIYLTTGTPGSGKTLWSLHAIKKRVEADNKAMEAEGKPAREVYYSGIADLRLPWVEFQDATKWNELPPGSVIVIDECQRVFRPRGTGAAVPEYISAMETHRHKGYDIYLITQHPMLVDQNIRRLCGQHHHIVRKFGISAATVHKWGSVHEITKRNLLEAERQTWPYSKEVMGYYKSAELHTHKAKLPKRVWFLLAAPLLIAALSWYAYQKIVSVGKTSEQIAPMGQGVVQDQGQLVRFMTPAEERLAYFEKAVPRVPGMFHTAPKYDEITQPVDAPFPSACLISKGFDREKGDYYEKCGCIDQQGHRYQTDIATCKKIAINGYFKDWGQEREKPAKEERDNGPTRQGNNNGPAQAIIEPGLPGVPPALPGKASA